MMLTERSGRMKVGKLCRSMSNVADILKILRLLLWLMNSLSRHILSASHASYTPLIRSYSSLIHLCVASSCLCFLHYPLGIRCHPASLLSLPFSWAILSYRCCPYSYTSFCMPNCIHLLTVMCWLSFSQCQGSLSHLSPRQQLWQHPQNQWDCTLLWKIYYSFFFFCIFFFPFFSFRIFF